FIADEVFVCGTAAQITSVLKIEAYSLPSDRPITQLLKTQLQTAAEGRDPRYSQWVTAVQLAR
ncbi:MAG TPA: branched chain amino acid aminotransferase, partial [Coleofasciculaceae cyanobacterium]